MQISKDSTTRNGGFRAPQQNNNLKDVRFLGKDQKSVKFRLPEDQEEDDDFDEDDNEFDDEFDEGFASHNQPPTNAHGTQANKTSLNGHLKGKFGSTSGKKSNKGSGMNKFIKGILGKTGGEKGCPGKTHNKAANQNGGSKNRDKNGAMDGKGAEAAHKNINDSCSKKVGENSDTGQKLDGKQLQKGFNAINTKDRRGSGGKTGPMGGHTGPMGGQMENFWGGNTGPVGGQMSNTGPMGGGQMGNFEAVRGLQPTTATAMNVGNFQRNPFNQEYMGHMMMMMNQQRENAYMRSQSPMSYGPPTMTDQYTHIFSDESTSSCSIM
uniref:Ubiquitin-fold modifier 1 n=1 Tax=Catalpa bungei TaxID=265496 RepID=A0A142CCZ3_9LAMI|nr:ubiquitin-fold modifier 1 [Catalpa bungei]